MRGKIYKWLENYLSDRTQYCYANQTKSSLKNVTCGVPQGSTLGPLLYLIYMNDLATVVDNLKIFADDTNIFAVSNNANLLENIGNENLTRFHKWAVANKLTINTDKTCFTVFNSNRNRNTQATLQINGQDIQHKNSTKYLGITIDNKLEWKNHISEVY